LDQEHNHVIAFMLSPSTDNLRLVRTNALSTICGLHVRI